MLNYIFKKEECDTLSMDDSVGVAYTVWWDPDFLAVDLQPPGCCWFTPWGMVLPSHPTKLTVLPGIGFSRWLTQNLQSHVLLEALVIVRDSQRPLWLTPGCTTQTTSSEATREVVCWEFTVKSFSHVRLFATPWTVACQALLSMGFSRQEYWGSQLSPFCQNFPRLKGAAWSNPP